MRISKSGLAFCIFITYTLWSCKDPKRDKFYEFKSETIPGHVGEKFPIVGFLDTAGTEQRIDLTKSELTIIDFWFNECPPCNEEMSQFKGLLEGKEKKISVVSISVSSFPAWKNIFYSKLDRYGFLKESLPNWTHLAVKSDENLALRNPIADDRDQEIRSKLNIMGYPSYFVLNREGKIVVRPVSAVEYLKALNL